MDLTLDIGNTLCKVGVFDTDGQMIFSESFENLSVEFLQRVCTRYNIRRSILSTVREEDSALVSFLSTHTQLIPFSHNSGLPIKIQYNSPTTLGLDRIANAVAAYHRYSGQPILSIQIGTCVVYDFIDSQGIYHGGAISPGIHLRFRALHHFTGRLPLGEKKEIGHYIGTDTQHSIESGVINGLIFEIKGFIDQYRTDFPNLQTLLIGGDAAYLQKSIKNVIFAGSNFILFGLHEILKINA